MSRKGLVAGLKGYENRLGQSRKKPEERGYRALHESAGVSFVARSRRKLTGKSSWFKNKKRAGREEYKYEEEGNGNVVTVPTRKEHRRAERLARKEEKRKKSDKQDIVTTSIMFVENTPHGELCARLQRGEDRNGGITNRRVKMIEMAGTSLGQTFSNRNPWAGAGCEREDCHTCHQGGKQDKKEDCFRRNIMYESRCGTCEDRQEIQGEEGRKRNKKRNADLGDPNIYVGETSRSLYERTKEHVRDGKNRTEDSHIAKHWDQAHAGEEMPEFRFKIVKTFRDSLSRQVAESVRIDLRGVKVLNLKTVYSRNRLPRLEIEKPEWERMAEEKWKGAAETKRRMEEEERERHELGEGQAVLDEEMMNGMWRVRGLGGARRAEQTEQTDRPSKRSRRTVDEGWGLGEDS